MFSLLEFLKTWIINIVTVMILITILEMLIPNNTMKAYVKIIIGLLVIICILQPLFQLTNRDIKIEDEIFKTSTAIDKNTLSLNKNHFQESQKQQFISLYKKRIEQNIQERIEYYNSAKINDIRIKIEEDIDKKTFGAIKKLEIVLAESIDTNKIENIKKDISSLYGTNKENIHIQ